MTNEFDLDALDEGEANVHPELREAYKKERERRIALEAKLSKQAFNDAGFGDEDSTQRKALEKFYTGDRTDADAIRDFAVGELGFTIISEDEEVSSDEEHTNPAPTLAQDIRSDEMDAGGASVLEDTSEDDELTRRAREALAEAIKVAREGGSNQAQIQRVMAAELERYGF